MARNRKYISLLIPYLSSVLRLLFPLFLSVSPVFITISMVILDGNDGFLYAHAGFNPRKYQFIDKLLDLYWYFFIMSYLIANRYTFKLFVVLLILFSWRLIGEAIFFITKNRKVFLFFPNIFEIFFWIQLGSYFLHLPWLITPPSIIYATAIIIPVVLFFEYMLHWRKVSFANFVFGNKYLVWKKQ